jgi:hypothetical protein
MLRHPASCASILLAGLVFAACGSFGVADDPVSTDDAGSNDGPSTSDAPPSADAAADVSGIDGAPIADAGGGDVKDAPDDSSDTISLTAACTNASSSMAVLDGDPMDYIHPGMNTFTGGLWSATINPTGSSSPTRVAIHLVPNNGDGAYWDFVFQSGTALSAKTYTNAQRAGFYTPGLEVTGDYRGCNTLIGTFQITAFTMNGGDLVSFTAGFVQRCEGGAPALRGCVHYQP